MRAMPSSSSSYYYNYGVKTKVTIEGKYGVQALQQAASTGRLFIGDGKSQPVTPAQWGPAPEVRWPWHEVTQASTGDSGWVLRPQLDEPQAKLCLNNPPLYLDSQRGVCGLAQVSGVGLGLSLIHI